MSFAHPSNYRRLIIVGIEQLEESQFEIVCCSKQTTFINLDFRLDTAEKGLGDGGKLTPITPKVFEHFRFLSQIPVT